MSNTHFVLPGISTTDMSKDDQGALIVNQAAAVIVKAYLENWEKLWAPIGLETGMTDQALAPALGFVGATNLSGADVEALRQARREMILTPDKLVALIGEVQNALRQF